MSLFALLLFAAAIAFGVGKWMRLPPIPLLVVMGLGLRQWADYAEVSVPQDLLRSMIDIGLAVLVFTAGVDLSPRHIRGRERMVFIVATSQFLVLGGAGIVTALLLDYSFTTALYIGSALSASSTLVVVKLLQQRRQMFEPFGRLVLGVLLMQDVFIVFILVFLLGAPEDWTSLQQWGGLLSNLGTTVLLGLLAAVLHRWCVPWFTRKVKLDDEELMLSALALLFVFTGLSALLGLPFVVGGFFAGFALSAFPMNGLVRGMLGSLSGFFLALFFICIGAIIVIPGLQTLGHVLLLAVVLLVTTLLLVTVIAERVGFSTRASIEAALLLSQTSEFSLLLALMGMLAGQMSSEVFSAIVLLTVLTMTLTPFIARDAVAWRLMRLHPKYRNRTVEAEALCGHALMLGYGRAGKKSHDMLKDMGYAVIVIDDDAAVVRRLLDDGVQCIQGDGSDERILRKASADNAALVLASMRRTRDSEKVLRYLAAKKVPVFVRTFEESEALEVEALGGRALRTADLSTKQFMQWWGLNS